MKEEQAQEVVVLGPGQILKQAREQANLTTQEIADKIRLKKTLIEDIEQDNYDINISLTFIKGYLKLYAKHVNVSEFEVITAFDKLNTQKKEPAKLQSFSRRIANQANDDKLMLVTYLIVAAVIALVVIWWFQQSSGDSIETSDLDNYQSGVGPDQTIIANELEPQAKKLSIQKDVIPPTNERESSNEIVANLSQQSPTPLVKERDLDIQTNTQEILQNGVDDEPETNEASTQETVEPVELVFEFAGDCWMNLADATGENIAYGVKVKGRVMPVSGIPPFVITLGAPEVVQIRYAGKPVDMSFLTPGRIAKFELPITE